MPIASATSDRQADSELPIAAMAALADEPLHVVATYPSGVPDGIAVPPNATVRKFAPHGIVLDRAVCAITHGGMGATQKALARGVPVCVVPFGRDQLEVARRVEVAGAGVRLPARRLDAERLRGAVRQAIECAPGARRVAEGYERTGGATAAADAAERLLARTPAMT